MKESAKRALEFLAKGLWLALISPVVIPAGAIAWLVSGRDSMDIGGGMMFGATFAAACFGVTMLYVGLAVGYLL